MKIVRFSQFQNEAKETAHSKLRSHERMYTDFNIEMQIEIIRELQALGLSPVDIKNEIRKNLEIEFHERYNRRIIDIDFTIGIKHIVVLFKPTIKLGNTTYPIRMAVTSYDQNKRGFESKTYHGEKICVYIAPDNNILTIKAQPGNMSDKDIKNDDLSHQANAHPQHMTRNIEVIQDNPEYPLEIKPDGTLSVILPQAPPTRDFAPVEIGGSRDYSLTKGRKLAIKQSKIKNDWIIGIIDEITNLSTARTDGHIDIILNKNNGMPLFYKDRKALPVKLEPGDYIGLPAKEPGDFEVWQLANQFLVFQKSAKGKIPALRVI